MSLVSEVNVSWETSCWYIKNSFKLLKKRERRHFSKLTRVVFNDTNDLCVISFASSGESLSLLNILTNLFERHKIEYKMKGCDPYVLCLTPVRKQTLNIYRLYKDLEYRKLRTMISGDHLSAAGGLTDRGKAEVAQLGTKLQVYLLQKSALLYRHVVAWIEDNAENLDAQLYMLNAFLLFKMDLQNESFAWHALACARVHANTEGSFESGIVQADFWCVKKLQKDFAQMLGNEDYQIWLDCRSQETTHIKRAEELFMQYQSLHHQPEGLEQQGEDKLRFMSKECDKYGCNQSIDFESQGGIAIVDCKGNAEKLRRDLLSELKGMAFLLGYICIFGYAYYKMNESLEQSYNPKPSDDLKGAIYPAFYELSVETCPANNLGLE